MSLGIDNIRVAELPTKRSLDLPVAFVREAIADLPVRQALERPAEDPQAGAASIDVELYTDDDNVYARGTLRGWIEVACGRCLATVRVPIDESLTVTFLPRDQMPEDADYEPDVELSEDDLDVYPYDGEEIDLAPLLREQLILAVPFAPLCAEDCQGLCAQCGANLNERSCDCEAPLDPRLAALKDIKL